jgi:hypothetical protein
MKQECKDCNKSLEDCTCIEDTIELPKQETTLEEVLGSSMCQFSVIENKLAILYRNQVKIYEAITKEQERMYSEEDMKKAFNAGEENVNNCYTYMPFEEWFETFKNK